MRGRPWQTRDSRRTTATLELSALLIAGSVTLAGCILAKLGIQVLNLEFALSSAIAAGEESLVHVQFFPDKVNLKKQMVRISGRVFGTSDLPDRIEVLVTAEDENGRVYDRATFDARLRDDGGFVVTRRWKKNLDAETTMSVFVTPIGGDLPKGLDVDLCVHVAKQKNALSQVADCAPGSFDLPAAFELELDSVGFHELISVEGAFPQDLGATSGRELVVALRDVSRPRQTCPRDDVPWDGCASVDWDDVPAPATRPPAAATSRTSW